MALLLRNMTIYTRFNRFKHCAINKEEKHKLMTRTGRKVQAQHNDTTQETELIVFNIAQYIKMREINRCREQVEKLKRNIMIPFRRPWHS